MDRASLVKGFGTRAQCQFFLNVSFYRCSQRQLLR